MITVHHLANSRSQRVLWLLEEMDLPYEIRRYERDPKTMLAPPALKAVHPLGKSPVVVDDGGQAVAESGAIVEYLIDHHGHGRLKPPPESRARLDYTYWLHYAEGSAMPPLLLKLVFSEVERAPMPFFVKPIARRIAQEVHKAFIGPQLRTHLDYIDAHLAASPWFAGDALTGADIQMSFPLEAAAFGGEVDGRRPHIRAYLDRIHARPAYQRALARGGDYAYA